MKNTALHYGIKKNNLHDTIGSVKTAIRPPTLPIQKEDDIRTMYGAKKKVSPVCLPAYIQHLRLCYTHTSRPDWVE